VKRALSILLLVGLGSLAALAQSNAQQANPPLQKRSDDTARLKVQRRYDPLGGQKHIKGGPLDGLMDSINPQDTDFGARLANARQALVGNTIENLYFWIIVGEGATTVQGSMRLDQRPWISATVIGQTIEAGKIANAQMRVQNIGRTPAMQVKGLITLEPIDKGAQPQFVYRRQVKPRETALGHFELGTLLPNAQVNFSVPYQVAIEEPGMFGEVYLADEMVKTLSDGSVRLYLHGEINYCDVFRIQHWIKFCYVYEPKSSGGARASDGTAFVACQQHNETDDEHDAQKERCGAAN
jgi:hypothetical protein